MILNRFDRLEKLTILGAKSVLTMDEACLITGLTKSTLYKKTADREVPHYRNGKFIYFKKVELEDWMTSNRIGSVIEDEQKAISGYLSQRVKKGGIR